MEAAITPEQIEILEKLFESKTRTDEDYQNLADEFPEDE